MAQTSPALAFGSLLAAVATFWLAQVNAAVKMPYMDEFFHIRQALVYWDDQWRVWDPKITTPPGLYIVSYLGLLFGRWLPAESLLSQLRAHNVAGILLVFVILSQMISTRQKGTSSAAHAAFNICTFPPLFFFCGLYYTDVMSVLVVMAAHRAFHNQKPVQVCVYSLLSLWFRQTNVFWTAIYLGGAEVVRLVKKNQPQTQSISSTTPISHLVSLSWSTNALYDPPIADAFLEDYFKMILSLAASASSLLQQLVVPLIPHVLTLGAFAAFIAWNGGVVLGDKESHVASLHLTQMLYIWPYIAFFSWPVMLPSLTSNIFFLLPLSIQNRVPVSIQPTRSRIQIRLPIVLVALLSTLLIIHYNTKIHPFLLADNRHYTFYVFRLLRKYSFTIYLMAPIYLFFAWACIGALSASNTKNPHSKGPPQIAASSLLLWTITSILSLATAPLVEPRYFILPWIIWRLDVSPQLLEGKVEVGKKSLKKDSNSSGTSRLNLQTLTWWLSKLSLPVETIWHLLINVLTGYAFLNKTFAWPNAPEEVMRFMW